MARYWFLWAIYIAVCYTAWPNLAKAFNLDFRLLVIMAIFVALVVAIIPGASSLNGVTAISAKAWMWIVVVLLGNATSILILTKLAADKSVPTGLFLVTIFIIQITVAPFLDWIISGTVMSLRQFFGVGFSILALWLIAGPK